MLKNLNLAAADFGLCHGLCIMFSPSRVEACNYLTAEPRTLSFVRLVCLSDGQPMPSIAAPIADNLNFPGNSLLA